MFHNFLWLASFRSQHQSTLSRSHPCLSRYNPWIQWPSKTGIHLRSFAQEFDALGRELSGKARLSLAVWWGGCMALGTWKPWWVRVFGCYKDDEDETFDVWTLHNPRDGSKCRVFPGAAASFSSDFLVKVPFFFWMTGCCKWFRSTCFVIKLICMHIYIGIYEYIHISSQIAHTHRYFFYIYINII